MVQSESVILILFTKMNINFFPDSDFGDIFGELLPGNTAKLEPPENQDITQGLEVKVCLGKVWKHSLTELSGGQRYNNKLFFCLFKIVC